MSSPRRAFALAALAAAALALPLAAARPGRDPRRPRWISGTVIQNDLFAGRDRDYTNGVGLVFVSPAAPAGFLGRLAAVLPPAAPAGARSFVSLRIGQRIYTPAEIWRSDLAPGDRPYAGVLSFGAGFHAIGERAMDSVTIEAGIVGPHSFAAEMQTLVHSVFGWIRPRGWDHQIGDEPFLRLGYDHKWKLRPAPRRAGLAWDASAHAGAALSNVYMGAQAGAEIRLGFALPGDFGSSPLPPEGECASLFVQREERRAGTRSRGVHVFAAVETRAIGRDVTIDGNSFRESPSVPRIPLGAALSTGIAYSGGRFRAGFGYVWETRQFRGQGRNPLFGSLNLSFAFKG